MTSPVKIWRRQKRHQAKLGQTGIVLSWTQIFTAGQLFVDQTPYIVAMVQMEDSTKMTGQLVNCSIDEVHMGMKVTSILRRMHTPTSDGVITYGLKFRPVTTHKT